MGVTQSVRKHGSHHALRSAMTLGHEGGELCITGATVKVPVGCVTEDVDFSVANINATEHAEALKAELAELGARTCSATLELLPHAAEFHKPVTLQLDVLGDNSESTSNPKKGKKTTTTTTTKKKKKKGPKIVLLHRDAGKNGAWRVLENSCHQTVGGQSEMLVSVDIQVDRC